MTNVEEIRREILTDFVAFLKKHNVYTKYRENMANEHTKYRCYGFKNMHEAKIKWRDVFFNGICIHVLYDSTKSMNVEHCLNLINYAFQWYDTPEGKAFWSNLDSKWRFFFYNKYLYYYEILNKY